MAKSEYEFGGWATRNDIVCSDGRVIRQNAFKDNDGAVVPLVWNHQHNDSDNVLGHALLENRPEGVYTYLSFNDTEKGQNARKMVEHGDISSLSIFANKLKSNGRDVVHGMIREVSLVLAGANPGAFIDTALSHSDDSTEEGTIYSGMSIETGVSHAEKDDKASKKEPKKNPEADNTKDINKENKKKMAEKTVQDVVDSMTEEQKNVMYALVGMAAEGKGKEKNEEGDDDDMKHNIFDKEDDQDVLMHSEITNALKDGKKYGSLKESFIAHGIDDIDYLFPDAKNIENTPSFIKRDDSWVASFMNQVSKSPFSRIKSIFADITEDEARAKGYLKGKQKKDEVFSLLKRTTTPTTIYKKQKLDRDDVIDITDFDVVAWIKSEMKGMLQEEIARACLVGDGRLASDDDKINETNIRPIYNDEDLYTIKSKLTVKSTATEAEKAAALIDQAVRARKNYKGSGKPTCYTTTEVVTEMLLLKDLNGHRIYKSVDELATAMRVKEIVEVEVMEGLKDTDGNAVAMVIVNPADYKLGADKGGETHMFDDFDIDYNAQKYLMETRSSGALIKPYSAITISVETAE